MKNVKKNGGFTLVELIVVIAILAILAAVAIPAYSGYIEKAEKAGDLQILGAVNSAFAAACVDNGFSQYEVKGAMIPVDDNGTIGNGTVTMAATPSAPKFISYLIFVDDSSMGKEALIALNNSFAMFFAGNETAAFKTFQNGLVWSPVDGGFVAMEDYEGDVTVSYKGVAITVSSADIQKIADSTYGEIGGEALLDKVDFASTLCTGMVGNTTSPLYSLVNSTAYRQSMADAMGFKNIGEYMTYLNSLGDADAKNAFLANSLVLSAAQTSSNTIDSTTLLTNLSKGQISTSVTSVDAIAETAAVYALYTAYAQEKGLNTDDITGNSTLNSAVITDDFMKYAASDKAKADLDAYLSAMDLVNNATSGNADGTKDVLTNGFSDPELKDLLGSLMG